MSNAKPNYTWGTSTDSDGKQWWVVFDCNASPYEALGRYDNVNDASEHVMRLRDEQKQLSMFTDSGYSW